MVARFHRTVTRFLPWSWIKCSSRWCVTFLCCDNNNIILGERPFHGQCSTKIVISWYWFNLKSAYPHLQHLSLVELLWMCICSLNSSLSVSFWFCEGLAQKSQAKVWILNSEYSPWPRFDSFWVLIGISEAIKWFWMLFLRLRRTILNVFFPQTHHIDHQSHRLSHFLEGLTSQAYNFCVLITINGISANYFPGRSHHTILE